MALELNRDSFIELVRCSRIVPEERLQAWWAKHCAQRSDSESPRELATALIADGMLTEWQVEQLLRGKHRGFVLGSYRILGVLGKGGMGTVYLAEHVTMRRRVALKVLPSRVNQDTSLLDRFHREAQAVAALDHGNIVRAYDLAKETQANTEINYLVMEYIDGASLQAIVDTSGPLGIHQAVDYLRQAASGLAHAHEHGLIHRDIKPNNLLVDRRGVVKILDLGLARFAEECSDSSITSNHNETLLGTADYISPEQAINSRKVDARTDIYSLGCVAYFMLAGQPPFNEGSVTERLMAHQLREPLPLTELRADIPADLVEIIQKMMAKPLAERLESAALVAEALDHWLADHTDNHVLHRTRLATDGSTISMRIPDEDTQIPVRDDLMANVGPPIYGDHERPPDLSAPPEGDTFTVKTIRPRAEPSGRRVLAGILAVIVFVTLAAGLPIAWRIAEANRDESGENGNTPVTSERPDATLIAPTPEEVDPAIPSPDLDASLAESVVEVTPTALDRFEQWRQFTDAVRDDESLLLYLPFEADPDEPSELENQSRAADRVTGPVLVHNQPAWVNGRWPEKRAVRLAGPESRQYLSLDDEQSRHFDFAGSFSIVLWFRVESFNVEHQALIAKGDVGWRLSRFRNSSVLHLAFNEVNKETSKNDDPNIPPWTYVNGVVNVDDQQWHHVAAVFDADPTKMTLSLYVDGRLNVPPEKSEYLSAPNDDPVTIGANSWFLQSVEEQAVAGKRTIKNPRYFHGDIDEVAIFSRALSSDEIKLWYEVGRPDEPPLPAAQK